MTLPKSCNSYKIWIFGQKNEKFQQNLWWLWKSVVLSNNLCPQFLLFYFYCFRSLRLRLKSEVGGWWLAKSKFVQRFQNKKVRRKLWDKDVLFLYHFCGDEHSKVFCHYKRSNEKDCPFFRLCLPTAETHTVLSTNLLLLQPESDITIKQQNVYLLPRLPGTKMNAFVFT